MKFITQLLLALMSPLRTKREFLKAVLKAELCFHRYVHFACVPIYNLYLFGEIDRYTKIFHIAQTKKQKKNY